MPHHHSVVVCDDVVSCTCLFQRRQFIDSFGGLPDDMWRLTTGISLDMRIYSLFVIMMLDIKIVESPKDVLKYLPIGSILGGFFILEVYF